MRKYVTCVYLVKSDEVCLGMKKRGFGAGLWNGTGGKIEEGETPENGAKREAKEEFNVELNNLENMGKILFIFKDGFEHECSLFVCKDWKNEPSESEEMAPKWFKINNLPLNSMWDTDKSWLPKILDGKRIEATFYFNDDAKTVEKFNLKELN
ncbi:MAG: 8-oxo-dGTP diphosphatase [Candidatus Shapirobacteria bacterium]|jgi:ADP-ribose pyrophosphatase YjhB (NUDIX family)